ncbi:MAG TPA: lipid-A-disaccharide synthase, partial [Chitinophagaceae bacterium]|nr:lipid-A-disaccharide synthase [Chitinophagaceae bacterium]
GTLVKHFKDLAFMGFVEVVKNLPTIIRNLKFCKADVLAFKPDVLILIDYPGFNLRIAEWAKAQGIRVVYYISPQVWAWKEGRVKMMKRCIDQMLVILPFEQSYYEQRWQWPVTYVGHPLVEVVDAFKSNPTNLAVNTNKPIVALLPGSRKQEILKKLPIMLAVSKHFPEHHFVVAQAPGLDADFYAPLLAPYNNVSSVSGSTYALLNKATAALVTSGTATLETALFKVPEVVCYKGNPISYAIAKRIITIKFISLVNLIMDKLVVTELIQNNLTVTTVQQELHKILYDQAHVAQVLKDYNTLYNTLKAGGNASEQAATAIVSQLTSLAKA